MTESVYEESTNTTDSDFYFEQYFAEEYKRYSLFTNVVYVLQFAVAVIGIIADITICGVLLRKKRLLKNFSNFHLFNLAMTDVVFRLALTPVLFAIENKEVRDGSNALTLAVTFVLLLGITLDRYFHIVHPIKARNITEELHKAILIIDDTMELLTYTSSVLNSVIFGYYNKSFREELKSCCCRINYSQCDAKTKSRKKTGQPEPQTLFFENKTMRSLDVCHLKDKSEFFPKVYFPKDTTKMTEDLEVITAK